MSICDATCKGCAYAGHATGVIRCCDFLLITHQRRGCPAGAGCTRRKSGKREQSLDARVYLLPPSPPPEPAETFRGEPELSPREKDRLKHRRRYVKIKAELAGRQRAAINAYKRETGYTNRTLAKALNVSPNTVNGWMQESRMADWKKLAAIGCQRPEGL